MDDEKSTPLVDRARRAPIVWIVTLPVLAISAGVVLIALNWGEASPPGLLAYTFNDPTSSIQVNDAVFADWFVIVGYAIVLAVCSIFVYLYAFADATRVMALVSMGVAAVVVVADVTENVLLLGGPHWRFAVSVAATIKFCMLVASIPVVLGFGHVLFRLLTSWITVGRVAKPRKKDGENEPAMLDVVDTIEVAGDETRWAKGFDVPPPAGRGENSGDEPRGLCLSGGGIRSACVAMGAMQTLARRELCPDEQNPGRSPKVLDTFDHIVSVSGGGYTAGAYLLALHEKPNAPRPALATAADRETSPVTTPPPPKLSDRFTEGSMEFDHIRRHSSFIADSAGGLAVALGVVFRNLVVALVSLFAPAVIAGGLIALLFADIPLSAIDIVPTGVMSSDTTAGHVPMVMWAIGVFVAAGVVALLISVFAEVFDPKSKRTSRNGVSTAIRINEAGLRMVQFSAGSVILLVTLCFAIPALMHTCWNIVHDNDSGSSDFPSAVGGVTALFLVQYVATLVAMLWRHKDSWWQRAKGLVGKGGKQGVVRAVPRGVISLITTALSLILLGVTWLMVAGGVAASGLEVIVGDRPLGPFVTTMAVAAGLILVVAALDVTSVSLHPFYRRRLAAAFAVRRGANVAEPYHYQESTDLSTHGTTGEDLPHFVFACAAAVTGTDKPAPGLSAYSYTMSADHIGGPEFGYLPTKAAASTCSPRLRRDLTVQAAMATSGAAFASSMGRQGRWYQKLLALSGARLGTWLPNPEFVREVRAADQDELEAGGGLFHRGRDRSVPLRFPLFRGVSYLYREVLGCNHRGARLLQVTDGGHYENLGLVECLRRKCRTIYCVDASGDPPPTLSTLHEAIRLAEYELGVRIVLREGGLRDIVPGSEEKPTEIDGMEDQLAKRVALSPIIVGDIMYPAAAGLPENHDTGLLIFAKAVLTDECPGWLKRYAAESPTFPHDSTSDQWFGEAQFAAYVELGRVLGRAAYAAEFGGEHESADDTESIGSRPAA
ncbi:hypothetical protein [Gordonia sp. NPDC003585]|uniref:hypothetical protein n=1 Tax=Gordonia sp. NPDC003585 TaxID=3154275 RepID=UPI0033A955D0